MTKRIPIQAAKDIASKHACRQVIILAWDGVSTHVVTYGKSVEDCLQAANGGNAIKRSLGWPESECNAVPARIKRRNKTALDPHMELIDTRTHFAMPRRQPHSDDCVCTDCN